MKYQSPVLEQLKQSKVALYGLGLTGMSMLRFLLEQGITLDVFDSRELPPTKALNDELLAKVNCQCGPLNTLAFNDYDFVLISPGISIEEPVLQHALQQGAQVFCDIELFARINEKPVIAVTGSNGKSTVVAWLTDFLNKCGRRAVVCGNYGVPVLDVIDQDVDVFVIELSSFQLDTTESLQCLAATVLNVTPDHLDRYKSFAHYAAAKRKIYRHANYCLFNASDAFTQPDNINDLSTDNEHRYAAFGTDKINLNLQWRYDPETQALFCAELKIADFQNFALKGHHNALNALAVMALASQVIPDVEMHMDKLASFSGLTHRCQFVQSINDIHFIDDSKATNVASCEAAILGLADNNNIVLIAGGDAKGADLSELQGAIENNVKHVYAIGKDKQQFADFVASAKLTLCDELKEAVTAAYQTASAGDIVLLSPACASIDMFSNYQARAAAFIAAVHSLSQTAMEGGQDE